MSDLTNAIAALQVEINRLGGKKYTIAEPHADHEAKDADSITQAAWNIAATLEKATRSRMGFRGHLLYNAKSLERWSNYLFDHHRGEFSIVDDKTHQLGIAILPCFTVLISTPQITGILPDQAMAYIHAQQRKLEADLAEFGNHKRLVMEQESTINTIVSRHAELPLPSSIHLTISEQLAHGITYSLDGPLPQLETARRSFRDVMSNLETYALQLTSYINRIHEDRAGLLRTRFTNDVRPKLIHACRELQERATRARTQHIMVSELLASMRREERQIQDRLAPGAAGDRIAIVADRNARIEAIFSQLISARERSTTASSSFSSRPKPKELMALQSVAEARRGVIEVNVARLESYLRMMTTKPYSLPELPELISALEYTATPVEISGWYTTAQAILQKNASGEKTILGVKFAMSSKELASLTALSAVVQEKMAQCRAELAITDIKVAPAADARRSHVWNTLFELPHLYQARLHWDREKQDVALLELQVKELEMKHRQANLDLLLTRLEFNLSDISPLQASLSGTFTAVGSMSHSQALEAIEQKREDLTAVSAWFDSKSTTTTLRTNSELFRALTVSIGEENDSYRTLLSLHATQGTGIPGELSGEQARLTAKTSAIIKQYNDLSGLITSFATEKSRRESEKLATSISSMNVFLERTTNSADLTRAERQELAQQIAALLESLRSENPFFEDLGLRAEAGTPVAAQLQRFQEKREQLAEIKRQLRQVEAYHQLKDTFFGTNPAKVGGVFGAYLQERANTYLVRDFFDYCAYCLFRCLGYRQDERTSRQIYIDGLRATVNGDPTSTHFHVNQGIIRGLRLFSPRAGGTGSLNSKLRELQTAVSELSVEATTPTPTPTATTP